MCCARARISRCWSVRGTVAELDHAVFLQQGREQAPRGVSRVYLGAEFCCWQLPPSRQLIAEMDCAHLHGLAVSIVVPVLTETFLPRCEQLLGQIAPHLGDRDEIVISDWGALSMVRSQCPDTEVVLGRVLSGQKRGGLQVPQDLSDAATAYFRRSRWHGAGSVELLRECAIRRVEFDNLHQGMEPLPPGLSGTLHTPYLFVTASRNCPWRESRRTQFCSAPCGEAFRLKATGRDHASVLLQRGNAQFIENSELPSDLKSLGIDRVVHHPALPR